jgi:hypothetical protein
MMTRQQFDGKTAQIHSFLSEVEPIDFKPMSEDQRLMRFLDLSEKYPAVSPHLIHCFVIEALPVCEAMRTWTQREAATRGIPAEQLDFMIKLLDLGEIAYVEGKRRQAAEPSSVQGPGKAV